MIGKLTYGASAVALIAATAVLAQPSQGDSKGGAEKQVCRTTVDTGSRLNRSRECHTAREWAELRRINRQDIEHVQNNRPMTDGE
jgi:hypothetical protein